MEAQGPLAGITRQLARYPLGSYANSPFAVLFSVNHIRAANTRPQTANRRQLEQEGLWTAQLSRKKEPGCGAAGSKPRHNGDARYPVSF